MDPSSASLSPSSNNGTRSHRRNHVLPASPPCTSVLVTSNSCGILPTNSVSFDFSRCVYMEGGVALNSSRERFPETSFILWPFAIVGFTIARKILLWWALYVWDSILWSPHRTTLYGATNRWIRLLLRRLWLS